MDLDYVQTKCLEWIEKNNFNRVVLQFKREELKHSTQISQFLKNSVQRSEAVPLEIYVSQSNTCCVDLLVTQHVTNVDGIIHVGNVCLSKPEINGSEIQKPVLFVFGKPKSIEDELKKSVESLVNEIRAIKTENPNARFCLLYDTSLIYYATSIETAIANDEIRETVEIANVQCALTNWETTSDYKHKFTGGHYGEANRLGFYILSKPIDQYDCMIYLGQNLSIQTSLEGPAELWKIIEEASGGFTRQQINVTRLLNKRISLVSRIKDDEELRVGVIITNPLPNLDKCMAEMDMYAKARKHVLYFISMIQTADEYKIGNFDLCDAFVIINSCSCSTILESLCFNRPILTELEFKLACGFEAKYGRVTWPGSSAHPSEENLINKRRVSEVSLALVHTRNELLERCSLARVNKWSGLDYKVTPSVETDGIESLKIEEGLTGIASSYISEPLEKSSDS